MYSRIPTLVRALPFLVAAAGLASCGGSSEPQQEATKVVRGAGFAFEAPAGRTTERTPRTVSVLPPENGGAELESVTRFPLVRPFRATLWPGVVTELDGVADKLAAGLGGTVATSEDVRVGRLYARRYEVAYEREGSRLRQRITFVFRGREEFQLLCRYVDAAAPPPACTLLESTFRAV